MGALDRPEADWMSVDKKLCLHCGACVGTCPENAIFLNDTIIEFYDNCKKCGVCTKVCPVGAIDMK